MRLDKKNHFIHTLYPNDPKKRKAIYKDNRIIQRQFETRHLNDLLNKCSKTKQEFRMFIVQRRNAKTLLPIIQRNVKPGSDIHSDEWCAYKNLKK